MDQEKRSLRLVDLEGVDRLTTIDLFFRSHENEPVVVDATGKDIIPTPVLQALVSASNHWQQRDLDLSIIGCSDLAKANLEMVGIDLSQHFSEVAG
jgi:anti-anti-sigma regulatory factor